MKNKTYLKVMALAMTITMSACQTGEEAINKSASQEDWKPIEITSDSEYIIARHVSEENDITLDFLELEGGIVIDMVYNIETDKEKVEEYRRLLHRANDLEIGFDDVYMTFAGNKADEESVVKLRAAQQRMEDAFTSGTRKAPLSQGELDDLTKKYDRFLASQEKSVSREIESSRTQACASLSTLMLSFFSGELCDLGSFANSDLPWEPWNAQDHTVERCYSGNGTSIHPNAIVDGYRFWAANAYNAGGPNLRTSYLFGRNVYIGRPLPPLNVREVTLYNPNGYAIRSQVESLSSSCRRVCHAVITLM